LRVGRGKFCAILAGGKKEKIARFSSKKRFLYQLARRKRKKGNIVVQRKRGWGLGQIPQFPAWRGGKKKRKYLFSKKKKREERDMDREVAERVR